MWSEYTEYEKNVHLTGMLLRLRETDEAGDPAIAILVPEDCEEEFSVLWAALVHRSIPDGSLEAQRHRVFPPIFPRPSLAVPTLHKSSEQEKALLIEFFQKKLLASGVDTTAMLPMNLTVECLRAFYLVHTIPPVV